MFSFFKKKKIIAHIKLNGVIGNAGKFKQGIDFAGQEEIIEKAFSLKKAKAVAITINSPGGSPVQSHLIYKFIRAQAKKNKVKVLTKSMPKYIWRAIARSQGTKVLDLIFDTTTTERGNILISIFDYFDSGIVEVMVNNLLNNVSITEKFTDKAHLKAKGLIPRSDGTKKVSDKYK